MDFIGHSSPVGKQQTRKLQVGRPAHPSQTVPQIIQLMYQAGDPGYQSDDFVGSNRFLGLSRISLHRLGQQPYGAGTQYGPRQGTYDQRVAASRF